MLIKLSLDLQCRANYICKCSCNVSSRSGCAYICVYTLRNFPHKKCALFICMNIFKIRSRLEVAEKFVKIFSKRTSQNYKIK